MSRAPSKAIKTPRAFINVSKIARPAANCGISFSKPSHTVRAKFESVDDAKVELAGYIKPIDIADMNIEAVVRGIGFEIRRAENSLNTYKNDLDPKIAKRSEGFIESAKAYLEAMIRIETSWKRGFYVRGFGMVNPWPIYMDYNDISQCKGRVPGYEHKGGIFSYKCPSVAEVNGHGLDQSLWKRLADTAARHARCAAEVVLKSAVLEKNKNKYYDSRVRGPGSKATTSPRRTGASARTPTRGVLASRPTGIMDAIAAGAGGSTRKRALIDDIIDSFGNRVDARRVDNLIESLDSNIGDAPGDGRLTDPVVEGVIDEPGTGVDELLGSNTAPPGGGPADGGSKKPSGTPILVAAAAVGAFFVFSRK